MTFAELSKSVAEAQLGNARMTDIKSGTYSLELGDKTIHLVSEKKVKVPISINSLAALRIVTDAAKAATCKTTREARDSENYSTLQKAITAENMTVNAATKFNVVHRLKIHDVATDAPVYRNEFYKGYPEYVKAARKAANMPNVTDEQKAAQRTAYTEATDALRSSGVKSSVKDEDASYQLIPVFTVS